MSFFAYLRKNAKTIIFVPIFRFDVKQTTYSNQAQNDRIVLKISYLILRAKYSCDAFKEKALLQNLTY